VAEIKPANEEKAQTEAGNIEKPRPSSVQQEIPGIAAAQTDILFGSIELQVTEGADPEELTEWTKALRNIPLLRVLSMQKSASDPGNNFLILTDAPTPLIGILKKMSLVKEVRKENDKIFVTLVNRGARNKVVSQNKPTDSKI
jgi:hypothetical protein